MEKSLGEWIDLLRQEVEKDSRYDECVNDNDSESFSICLIQF